MTESPRQTAEPLLPGEAGPRITAAIARRLAPELAVALRAADQFRRRPSLALAVVALATATFVSEMTAQQVALRRYYPDYARAARGPVPNQTNFTVRWARTYRPGGLYPVLLRPLTYFAWPLERAAAPANGLVRSIWWRLGPVRPIAEMRPWRDAGFALLVLVPSAAVSTAFLVVLLGWVRDSDRRLRLADLPRFWKAHYVPVVAISIILAAWQATSLTLTYLWPFFPFSWGWSVGWSVTEGSLVSELVGGALDVVAHVLQWVILHGSLIVVMLAPFVIVARKVGATAGIVEGLRLLRRRWLTLVVLFLAYRVVYEALTVWRALSPWLLERGSIFSLRMPGPLLWLWVGDIGLALLGLWVAYAFVEIAKCQATAPTDTGPIGAADDGAVGRIHGLGDAAMKGNTIEG